MLNLKEYINYYSNTAERIIGTLSNYIDLKKKKILLLESMIKIY